jgi:hypothetical protein
MNPAKMLLFVMSSPSLGKYSSAQHSFRLRGVKSKALALQKEKEVEISK